MDEHGIAAALLPLVTAFCRVSILTPVQPSPTQNSLEDAEAGRLKD